jgi:hypothetical protein
MIGRLSHEELPSRQGLRYCMHADRETQEEGFLTGPDILATDDLLDQFRSITMKRFRVHVAVTTEQESICLHPFWRGLAIAKGKDERSWIFIDVCLCNFTGGSGPGV